MKLDKKTINLFLIITLIIIISETLNVLYYVKNEQLYNEFFIRTKASFNDYLTLNMLNYFSNVAIFIIFSLYNYFLNEKLRINTFYKSVWSLLIFSNILFKVFVYRQLDSIFYYISILFQIILFTYIIVLKDRKE